MSWPTNPDSQRDFIIQNYGVTGLSIFNDVDPNAPLPRGEMSDAEFQKKKKRKQMKRDSRKRNRRKKK